MHFEGHGTHLHLLIYTEILDLEKQPDSSRRGLQNKVVRPWRIGGDANAQELQLEVYVDIYICTIYRLGEKEMAATRGISGYAK